MKPSNFKEANKMLRKPENMSDEQCTPLPVFTNGEYCVSCWKPSWKERLSILVNGKVWLGVLSGETQSPVWIDGSKSVFNKLSIKQRILTVWSRDKQLHTLVGFLIAFVLGLWFPFLGLGLGIIAGAAKEYWDSRGNGCVELLDFVFTVVGAAIGFALNFFFVSPFIHSII